MGPEESLSSLMSRTAALGVPRAAPVGELRERLTVSGLVSLARLSSRMFRKKRRRWHRGRKSASRCRCRCNPFP